MNLTTSFELMFALYGGFLLRDSAGAVVVVQAITRASTASPSSKRNCSLQFSTPRKWRSEFTQVLSKAGRLQGVTLPELKAAGAEHFCWISPRETFVLGEESWRPATHGAFLYLLKGAASGVWFPCRAPLQVQQTGGARARERGDVAVTDAVAGPIAKLPDEQVRQQAVSRQSRTATGAVSTPSNTSNASAPARLRRAGSCSSSLATAAKVNVGARSNSASWVNPLTIGKAESFRERIIPH